MFKIRILIILYLSFTNTFIIAQRCEDTDKRLFHLLPDTIPGKINCVDSIGFKQGWWIDYTLKYNPVEIPDVLPKGDYVEDYSFGNYKDNIKTGDWISVANVHLIHVTRKDNYFYSKDTIIVTSGFEGGGWNESQLYFNSDSSIIKSSSLSPDEKYPVCIECNKNVMKGKECLMTFRNEKIKDFPIERFDMEFYSSFLDYKREKKEINTKLGN
jgi:hypothetical protein